MNFRSISLSLVLVLSGSAFAAEPGTQATAPAADELRSCIPGEDVSCNERNADVYLSALINAELPSEEGPKNGQKAELAMVKPQR